MILRFLLQTRGGRLAEERGIIYFFELSLLWIQKAEAKA